ncbi:hypothetical protein CRE_24829 [Caenorhabditis remanei]|uniref:Uncharacterized protein n=1 Tax=Caenorhabditis remanei TaxID=31234 RepID=E3NHP1_CAERE|nr:hypothetical protein CRE_24829 [Caenorhabditis remanei]
MSGKGDQYQVSTQRTTSGLPQRVVQKTTADVKVHNCKNGGQIVTTTQTHQQKKYYPPSN